MATKINTKHGMLSITEHAENGKLAGFYSLNTSVSNNSFCQKMRKCNGAICQSCFASTMEKRYKQLEKNNIANGDILSKNVFSKNDVPFLNYRVFRLHSNGELINELHFRNYLTIAAANPGTTFTLWTKRTNIVSSVLKDTKKPKNLILIYSSPKIDKEEKLPLNFDKVFTVYSKKESENVKINCGGKKCKDCMLCYTKNRTKYIKELKK